jgi:hypothetical protein
VPLGSRPPTDAAKRRFNHLFPKLLEVLSSYHVVMEGTGFFAAFKRATLTTLLQPFWRRRMFHVHANCNEVLVQIQPSLLPIAKNLLELATIRGFLESERQDPELAANHDSP